MSIGLTAGLKALTAAQMGIQTAGQNVANANTAGYSRQRVMQSGAMPFSYGQGLQIGTGVNVDNISRIVDQGLERRLNMQLSFFGSAAMNFDRLRELESVLSEPNGGLSASISEMFGGISSLQTDPGSRSLRSGAIQGARSMAENFNLIASRYQDLQTNTVAEVQALVGQVNEKTTAIADLNAQIISIEAGGSTANDLRDQRGRLISEVSELIDTRALERSSGSVDLLVAGRLLVSGASNSSLSARTAIDGRSEVLLSGNSRVDITSGKIGALMNQEEARIPALLGDLDVLARNMILEFNRVHSTGIGGSGPFQSLITSNRFADTNSDGTRGNELLGSADLPFDVVSGQLYVSVTDRASGDMERAMINIDPMSMTLEDLAVQLSGIDHLTASVDPTGRMRVTADQGYGFDFGSRLDPMPDSFGSFGSAYPSLGNSGGLSFDLSDGPATKEFTVDVNGTAETVTLDLSDFSSPGQASVDELVSAINADLTNATAANVGGHLVIRADNSGPGTTLTLADTVGSPLSTLGMATGPTTGQTNSVDVRISGSYTGESNEQLRFIPDADGIIGSTPNLTIGVFNSSGSRVATPDVGANYVPDIDGPIEVVDGINVSFSRGAISATDNQAFSLDTLADSDTSDVLVAIGMNSFFLGNSAETIEVNPDLVDNPDLLAAARQNASGDGGNLSRLAALRDAGLGNLNANTIETFYNGLVGDLGFEVSTAESTMRGQETLLNTLEAERESVSGVNLDEEMVDIVRYQQAFEAASRFINIVQELTTTLINLGR
ncbi:MAG: flagellar hook-associated protein FlgK [Planctomycetota bacterium]|jgi:flagellar hook-associated protein 1 FlgK